MHDAIGGVVNLVIIVVFMIIVSGYLAFNVNYTKAFRVKNKIITYFEQYEGNCTNQNSVCVKLIDDYMAKIGYDRDQNFCSIDPELSRDGYTCVNGFGYKKIEGINENGLSDQKKYYYKIVTQITIDFPIINKVMQGMKTFKIRGDTKTFIVSQ